MEAFLLWEIYFFLILFRRCLQKILFGIFPWNYCRPFNIHDSCPTRNNPEIHKGVRDIMDGLGYKYEELELSGTKTMCCGLKGMALVLNPPVAKKIINKRASSSTTGFMLTYCAACRSALEMGGVDTIHLADLLFQPCYTKDQAKARNISSVDQWKTRYQSKQALIKESKS
jgi:Fe-S oxidoreductase